MMFRRLQWPVVMICAPWPPEKVTRGCRGALGVKPDMIFGKRGLNGLVYYQAQQPGDITLEGAHVHLLDLVAKVDDTAIHLMEDRLDPCISRRPLA